MTIRQLYFKPAEIDALYMRCPKAPLTKKIWTGEIDAEPMTMSEMFFRLAQPSKEEYRDPQ